MCVRYYGSFRRVVEVVGVFLALPIRLTTSATSDSKFFPYFTLKIIKQKRFFFKFNHF